MLKNYIKIALRQLWQHKLFSALNIFGLATSMSVCLLLIMILSDQYSYDAFHEKGDHIYRVISASSEHQLPEKPRLARGLSFYRKYRSFIKFWCGGTGG